MISDYELIVDNFAGGGGASTGIEMALGRHVDIAVNHDPEAISLHKVNHPHTRHYCEDVWNIDPIEVCAGRPVGLLWLSPDCKHFSKAKGGKPVEKKIRGLAWIAVKWAKLKKPRVIMLENVEEFQDWGPLLEDGMPCPVRKGLTFRRFLRQLENCGYKVEHKELVAADYGAPTIRKRLFLIARCDGQPIVWPEPTHGEGLLPYRTAAECIDWSVPCPSIFGRAKPLAENTMRRIARGVQRYVIDAADPFIVPITHTGDSRVHAATEPFRTITAAHRGELALAVPFFKARYGERPEALGRKSQEPRVRSAQDPFATIVPTGNGSDLVAAFLAKHNGGHEATGSSLHGPVHTVTATDSHALAVSHLTKFYGTSTGADMRKPMPTHTADGNHLGEVRAFLLKYYGTDQDPRLNEPMHTLTTKARMGLVTVHGVDYQIVDIGMRMLQPRELYRAQGFPDTYVIDRQADGRPLTKTASTRMCGNSVCPPLAAALVNANFHQQRKQRAAEEEAAFA